MTDTEQPVSRDDIAAEYFDLLPFDPYPVQEEALLAYFAGDTGHADTGNSETGRGDQGVLVCAPTGTGKTLIAEAAVYEALRTGKKMYYTTPLIALTDQKLDELSRSAVRWGFPANSVGLVTGNRCVNRDAPVLVVVAEILLNRLLNPESFDFSDVTSVVMDEFHSFNDRERGVVWELTLGLLPPHVRTLLLSATVGNAVEFTSWLSRNHRRTLQLAVGTERKVPLEYSWIDDEILPDFAERIASGDEQSRQTPALMFCFSRSQCWSTAELLKGKSVIDKDRQKAITGYLSDVDMSEGAGPKLKAILMRGVGVHHAGVLPRYRRIVEDLFCQKLLAFCVCTETLAAGINLPARSVVLPSLMKGPRDKKKLCETASAQQIFGRAGRPQFDSRGYVFALAHEDDVKLNKWREKYDSIPEDTKDPGLLKAKKQLKKKMPKRRTGETYWTQSQFEQLQNAESANLVSQGRWPWRLLAYLFGRNPNVQPIREMVGKRLLSAKAIDEAQRDLNRMLITFWTAGYLELDPKPRAASPKKGPPKKGEHSQSKKSTGGLFGEILDQMQTDQPVDDTVPNQDVDQDPDLIQSRGYEVEDYQPETATPTESLSRLVHLRSVHPLFGVYVADQLAAADPMERIGALESVLEVPGTVARFCRVPSLDEMPAGELATHRLDPKLLQLGLATPEELGAKSDDQVEVTDQGYGRVMFEEPRVWPLTIGEKLLRLFQHEFPRVHDVSVRPVWIVGELAEFGFDFNKYVTARKLQKEEGILFRHCLRMILLLDEMANIPPLESTVQTWEDPLDDLADQLTEACRKVDPQSTDEVLVDPEADNQGDKLIEKGRRNG